MPNPDSEELLELAVQKVGTTYANRQTVDLSAIPECALDGFENGFEKYPPGWSDPFNRNCSNSSADRLDGSITTFRLNNVGRIQDCGVTTRDGGNCLDEFLALTNYAAGDTIRIKYQLELMKNPLRAAFESQGLDPGPIAQNQVILAQGVYEQIDPNGGAVCNTSLGTECAINSVFRSTCPGDVSSLSEVTLEECLSLIHI